MILDNLTAARELLVALDIRGIEVALIDIGHDRIVVQLRYDHSVVNIVDTALSVGFADVVGRHYGQTDDSLGNVEARGTFQGAPAVLYTGAQVELSRVTA